MTILNIQAIEKILPERYPLLLVDRILELDPGERALGRKNVTINEEFFRGHFPGHPVMPGVLILEALGQVGRVLLHASTDSRSWRIVRVEGARFRRPVVPGDTLQLRLTLKERSEAQCTLRGEALLDDGLAAEADLVAVPAETYG